MLVSPPDLQWDSGGGDGAHATAAVPKGFHGSRGVAECRSDFSGGSPQFMYLIQNIRRSEGSGFLPQSLEMSMSLNCFIIVRITPRSKLQSGKLQVF